ncbi:Nucleotidyltransferase family protein [Candidatus Hepatincolaceae symbiont of Richtersius coronifer]
MKAIILAGGLGTRLKSLLSNMPKPMAPINGQPFLAILLQHLKEQGIQEVIIAVGYLKDAIITYFGNNYLDMKITYSMEQSPLGTGGAIFQALKNIEDNENVLILNGDTFCPIIYGQFLKYYMHHKANFAIVLKQENNIDRYGKVEINEKGEVIDFLNTKDGKKGLINCGIYLLNKSVFKDFTLPNKFSFEIDFLQKYIKDINLLAYKVDNYFIDIGVPEDYQSFCNIRNGI